MIKYRSQQSRRSYVRLKRIPGQILMSNKCYKNNKYEFVGLLHCAV